MTKFSVISFVLVVLCCQCRSSAGSKISHMHPPPSHFKDDLRFKRNDPLHGGYESTSDYWRIEAQKKLRCQLKKKENENEAKNVIFFIGDGMSVATLAASRIYMGQKQGHTGEESVLSFETFPYVGLSKVNIILCGVSNVSRVVLLHQTYCYDKQTADSACSATAYLTGVKANYATLGVNPQVRFSDCKASLDEKNHVSSIMRWAQKAGKSTGIVTTTRITHASPAGAYANSANRDWESDADMKDFLGASNCSDIAKQLIRGETGRNLNVIYGGGRKKFISEKIITEEDGQKGQRSDGLDLIDEWLTTKNSPEAHYIHNRQGLIGLNNSDVEHVRILINVFP